MMHNMMHAMSVLFGPYLILPLQAQQKRPQAQEGSGLLSNTVAVDMTTNSTVSSFTARQVTSTGREVTSIGS